MRYELTVLDYILIIDIRTSYGTVDWSIDSLTYTDGEPAIFDSLPEIEKRRIIQRCDDKAYEHSQGYKITQW